LISDVMAILSRRIILLLEDCEKCSVNKLKLTTGLFAISSKLLSFTKNLMLSGDVKTLTNILNYEDPAEILSRVSFTQECCLCSYPGKV
jgi:hypothetical protein